MEKITHPALLELENEKLRDLLLRTVAAEFGYGEWPAEEEFQDALSQQADAAPAQDERSDLNDWFLSLPHGRQMILREDKWMLANAAFEAGRDTRPAQAEQPPVGWEWIEVYVGGNFDGEEVNYGFYRGADKLNLRPSVESTEIRQRPLYAAPVAQIELVEALPEELFDGHAVYQETVRHRREAGLLVRTSPENVSDALDAVVRLIRARNAALAAQGGRDE